MKLKLSDFIPPILCRFLIKSYRKTPVYPSYDSAIALCGPKAYEDEDLCNVIADKTIRFRDSAAGQLTALDTTNIFLLQALTHVIDRSGKKPLTVIDFGGACGMHYFEIKNFLPSDVSINWIVIETPQMVKSATEKGLSTNSLSFRSDMEGLPKADLVYSSGTLQYTNNPYLYLSRILDIKTAYLLFNRMSFTKNLHEVVTIQHTSLAANGKGSLPAGYTDKKVSYPHTTIPLQKFTEITSRSCNLLWEFPSPAGELEIINEPTIGLGMFYSKH